MSSWLFNIYIDGVVGDVNFIVIDRRMTFVSENKRKWLLNKILYVDVIGT
jgi:hypothetical protein